MTKDREVSTFLIAVLLRLCNTEAKDAYQKSESTCMVFWGRVKQWIPLALLE